MGKITKLAGSLAPFMLCVLAGGLPVCAKPSPRTPIGIYAVVPVDKEIAALKKGDPNITDAQLDAYFYEQYMGLLGNPAVSGLALQIHWDTLNPYPPSDYPNAYYWDLVDLAFAEAEDWNLQHPDRTPKTIQLILDPGFQSPQWVLDQIPSCDGLFDIGVTTLSTCGEVTFFGYSEPTDGNVLPLPWNAVYKNAWQEFLAQVAARYPSLVSIAVDGPSAASAEITTASNADTTNPQEQFSGGYISPNDMWLVLLEFHYPFFAYQGTDQAFIDEWDAAIDMYGKIFSGVTLVATMGEKLPDFNDDTYPVPTGFGPDCKDPPSMSCAAETTILAYFVEPTVGGKANAKATQTSSFTASHANLSLGIKSVKQLSQRTAQSPAPSAQILGGIQFDQSFAAYPVNEGCTMAFPPDASELPSLPGCTMEDAQKTPNSAVLAVCVPTVCFAGFDRPTLKTGTTFGQIPAKDLIPPEQALYNLLNIYFDGTPAAASFGGTPGSTPLNYVQIYAEDIVYATDHAHKLVPVIENGQSSPVLVTAQSMLELASQLLFQIAEP